MRAYGSNISVAMFSIDNGIFYCYNKVSDWAWPMGDIFPSFVNGVFGPCIRKVNSKIGPFTLYELVGFQCEVWI